jgi:hypothetical protein
MSSLAAAGAATASIASGGQLAAATEAQGYLVAVTAAAHGVPPAAVAPFRLPEGLVGSTAAGLPMETVTGFAPLVYWRRVGPVLESAEGLAAAGHWLDRVAASEPMRAANETILGAVAADPRTQGRYSRETAPGACEFCARIADRGYIAWSAGMTFAAHGNCRCTAGPVVNLGVPYDLAA